MGTHRRPPCSLKLSGFQCVTHNSELIEGPSISTARGRLFKVVPEAAFGDQGVDVCRVQSVACEGFFGFTPHLRRRGVSHLRVFVFRLRRRPFHLRSAPATMLRTAFLISLVALLAALYLPIDRDALLSKLFSGSSEQGRAVKERSSGADHSSVTGYASTASFKSSEAHTASYQDYTDPRPRAEGHAAEPSPPDESLAGQQPLLPGPDEMSADDAAILDEEAQLERLGPIIVNSDGVRATSLQPHFDIWDDLKLTMSLGQIRLCPGSTIGKT